MADAPDFISDEDMPNFISDDQMAQRQPSSQAAPDFISDDDLPNFISDDQMAKMSPQAKPKVGGLETAAEHFVEAAPVTVGTLPAIGAGAAAGTYLGGALGTAVPGIGNAVGASVGGFLGGVAGALGAAPYVNKAKDWAMEQMGLREGHGFFSAERRQAGEEQHPYASLGGELMTAPLAFSPGQAATTAANRLFGAAVGGGLEAGQELYQGETPDPTKIGMSAAAFAAFPHPRKYASKLMELPARPFGGGARPWEPPAPAPEAPEGNPTPENPPGRPDMKQTEDVAADKDTTAQSVPPNVSRGVAQEKPPPNETKGANAGNPQSAPTRSKRVYKKGAQAQPQQTNDNPNPAVMETTAVSADKVAAIQATQAEPAAQAPEAAPAPQAPGPKSAIKFKELPPDRPRVATREDYPNSMFGTPEGLPPEAATTPQPPATAPQSPTPKAPAPIQHLEAAPGDTYTVGNRTIDRTQMVLGKSPVDVGTDGRLLIDSRIPHAIEMPKGLLNPDLPLGIEQEARDHTMQALRDTGKPIGPAERKAASEAGVQAANEWLKTQGHDPDTFRAAIQRALTGAPPEQNAAPRTAPAPTPAEVTATVKGPQRGDKVIAAATEALEQRKGKYNPKFKDAFDAETNPIKKALMARQILEGFEKMDAGKEVPTTPTEYKSAPRMPRKRVTVKVGDTEVLARNPKDLQRKQGAVQAVQGAYDKFIHEGEHSESPTDLAQRLQAAIEYATKMNGEKNPLGPVSQGGYRPAQKNGPYRWLMEAQQFLRGPKTVGQAQKFVASEALIRGGAEKEVNQTKRINADIEKARRPSAEEAVAKQEATSTPASGEGEAPPKFMTPKERAAAERESDQAATKAVIDRAREVLWNLKKHNELELLGKLTPEKQLAAARHILTQLQNPRDVNFKAQAAEPDKAKEIIAQKQAEDNKTLKAQALMRKAKENGEKLTLTEAFKRLGKDEEGGIVVPFSGKKKNPNVPGKFKGDAGVVNLLEHLQNSEIPPFLRLPEYERQQGRDELAEKQRVEGRPELKNIIKDEEGSIPLPDIPGVNWAKEVFSRGTSKRYSAQKPMDAEALHAAEISDDMHQMTQEVINRRIENQKKAEGVDADLRTAKAQKEIYTAQDYGNTANLPAKLKDFFTSKVKPILDDTLSMTKDLMEWDPTLAKEIDQDHIHRISKGYNSAYDVVEGGKSTDPVQGTNKRSLSTMTGPLMERQFMALTDGKGHRMVISEHKGGFTIWDKGNETKVFEPDFEFKKGETVDYDNKTWTVDKAHTDEIEGNGRFNNGKIASYHQNAMLSALEANSKVYEAWLHAQFLHKKLPNDSRFLQHATDKKPDAKGPRGNWEQVDGKLLPQMRQWYMSPQMREVFEDYAQPGFKGLDRIRAMAQAVTKMMFWLPTPHIANVATHAFVQRGWDWLTPEGYKNLAVTTTKAIKSVMTQDPLQTELRRRGIGSVFGGVLTRNHLENIGRQWGEQIQREPSRWDPIAKVFGIDARTLGKAVYDASARVMWAANDVMLTQAILERQLKGESLAKAISHAEQHIPNYRVPARIMGSRLFSQFMQDPATMAFGRYHYGVFNSYANIAKNLVHGTGQERNEAIGNLMAMGILAYGVYPVLDRLYQWMTDNKDAEAHRRGPLAVPTHVIRAFGGGKFTEDLSQAAKGVFTVPPAVTTLLETINNQDFAGRPIVERGTAQRVFGGRTVGDKLQAAGAVAAQLGEHTARGLVSPYNTIAGAWKRGASPGATLRDQTLDISNPSPQALKYRAQMQPKDIHGDIRRQTNPHGPLESLYYQATGRK